MSPTKSAPYKPPVSKDGKALPPINPEVSLIVRKDDAVPVEILQPYHRNPNKGDVPLIRESVERNNLYRSIVVNVGTLTERPFEILAGNHTWQAVKAAGREHIAVDWVDVSDEVAAHIVVVDNRAAEKGKRDVDLLAGVLADMDDLAGSGYTSDDLARLVAPVGSTKSGEDFATRFELVVECEDEDEQQELYDRLVDEGLTVRVLSM